MAGINLDLTNVNTNDSGGWRSLPAGEYRLMIMDAQTRELKSGNGTALTLECQVLGGDHQNKKIFENLNVIHSNEKAQQIAQRILATLLDATGIPRNGLTDTQQLCGKTVVADIKRSKAGEGYGDADGFQNSIQAFASLNGAAPQLNGGSPQVQATAQPVATEEIPF